VLGLIIYSQVCGQQVGAMKTSIQVVNIVSTGHRWLH